VGLPFVEAIPRHLCWILEKPIIRHEIRPNRVWQTLLFPQSPV
jgi:hypothetical protein